MGAPEELNALAERVVVAAESLGPLRAALLAGSAARGDADFYSDLDLLLYADDLPPPERFVQLCAALGGAEPLRIAPRSDDSDAFQFTIDGIAVQVCFQTVAAAQSELASMLDERSEVIDSPRQKILAGFVEGRALRGAELLEPWRQRASDYPEELRREAVERHWRFFPLWYYDDALAARDAELWRLDLLLDGAFNLLGVLAALHRVYYARFELKRLRVLTAKLARKPPRLADRLESLFTLPTAEAAEEFGRLVAETRALVLEELPDLELPLRRMPGERIRPWRGPD